MAYLPEPQQPRPSMMKRLVGIIVLMAFVVITALVIIYGFTINTIFDSNLAALPQFAALPTPAQDAFNTGVAFQLTTYQWLVVLVILLAIGGTVAAIFGGVSTPEGADDMSPDY